MCACVAAAEALADETLAGPLPTFIGYNQWSIDRDNCVAGRVRSNVADDPFEGGKADGVVDEHGSNRCAPRHGNCAVVLGAPPSQIHPNEGRLSTGHRYSLLAVNKEGNPHNAEFTGAALTGWSVIGRAQGNTCP
jgi:hypothetical protein